MSDQEIIDLYLSGLDSGTVGQRAGTSSATVLNILKRAGIPRRSRGNIPGSKRRLRVSDQEIGDRYLKGESGVSLAASLRVSQKTIYTVLESLGIPRRSSVSLLKKRNRIEREERQRKQAARQAKKPAP